VKVEELEGREGEREGGGEGRTYLGVRPHAQEAVLALQLDGDACVLGGGREEMSVRKNFLSRPPFFPPSPPPLFLLLFRPIKGGRERGKAYLPADNC